MGEHDYDATRARPFSFGQAGLRPLVAIAPSLPIIAFGESRFARSAEIEDFLGCFVVLCTTFAEGDAGGGSER